MADAAEPSRSIDTVDLNEEKKLKYLEFVQVAAMFALVCFSSVYEYAKENAGPLKPGVETVEGTVKTVIGPVYDKFQDLPFQLLKFVDRKVDESLDRHVPRLVKQASDKALLVAQRTPEVARELASEVRRAGLVDAAKNAYAKYEPVAEEVYQKYEPVAEQYAVSAWRSLNRLPLVPQVAQIVVPTAAYWSEKYNGAVCFAAERGIPVAVHLPLVPTERIAKAFDEAEHDCPAVSTHGGALAIEH